MSNPQSTANPLDSKIPPAIHHSVPPISAPTPNPIAQINPTVMMPNTALAGPPVATAGMPGIAMSAVPANAVAATAAGGTIPGGKDEYEEIREQV